MKEIDQILVDQILEGLIRRTDAAKLRWLSSVEDDAFLASVDAITVVVTELSKGGFGSHFARYQLQILNDNGDTVAVVETNDEFGMVPEDRRATLKQTHQMNRLHQLARRSALNTQATLEKLAKALEA